MSAAPLWTSGAMAQAMRAQIQGALPEAITGLSIDSRTIAPGDAYFSIKGDVHDGHDFVDAALKAGAALAVVERAQRDKFAPDAPLLVVDDVLAGLVELGLASRARLEAQVIAITGSVGKTSTKEALRRVLEAQGPTHASASSFNNHWGVPLSLARCPAQVKFAIFEIGMNHAGEIETLVKDGAAACRRHHHGRAGASGILRRHRGDCRRQGGNFRRARARRRGGAQPRQFAIRAAGDAAPKSSASSRIVSFGADAKSDARLIDVALHPDRSAVHANILGHDVTYKLGMPGRHMAMNSLAVLAAASLAGADLALAALSLSQIEPAVGRGARRVLEVGHGEATLIDESYNANPASMAAALNVLGSAAVGPAGPAHRGARRHARIGPNRPGAASRPE